MLILRLIFFNAGVQDDKFITILNSNKNCDVAVKTPWGQKTQRIRLNNIEMQGTVLAGLKCSVSIDLIGKEALENAGVYILTTKVFLFPPLVATSFFLPCFLSKGRLKIIDPKIWVYK